MKIFVVVSYTQCLSDNEVMVSTSWNKAMSVLVKELTGGDSEDVPNTRQEFADILGIHVDDTEDGDALYFNKGGDVQCFRGDNTGVALYVKDTDDVAD
jgi:hypothetical protein